MKKNVKVHVVRVFVDENGNFGNPLGIVFDEKSELLAKDRQAIATKLSFSETIFIRGSSIRIYNPKEEVRFSGYAILGTAWFVNKLQNKSIDYLICAAGRIKTWKDNNLTWIRASLDMLPSWYYEQLNAPEDVEHVSLHKAHNFVWAWIDEKMGSIRARTFAPDWGIPEDEANGSGSMRLAATLGRKLEVHHGKGSVIYSMPWKTKWADLGGRVTE